MFYLYPFIKFLKINSPTEYKKQSSDFSSVRKTLKIRLQLKRDGQKEKSPNDRKFSTETFYTGVRIPASIYKQIFPIPGFT